MRTWLGHLLVTMIVLTATTVSGQEVLEREGNVFATEQLSMARLIAPKAKVLVASAVHLSGTIKITSHESDSLLVRYVKVAKAGDRSQAIDFIDVISVVIDGRSDSPVIEMRSPNPAPWSGTDYSGMVEAEIIAPTGCEIEVRAQAYDVTVIGPLRALTIPESLGKLEISDIAERLNVATANRQIKLSNIKGQVSAVTSNSTLLAENITSLEDQARFRNDGGDIEINGLVGTLDIKNSYGRITIERFESRGRSSYVRGASGPISIEVEAMTEGQLVVSNRQEDVEIAVPDTLSAFYTLSVDDDGIIEATNFSFTPDLVEHNRLNLQSGDGRVDILGSVKGKGNIYIRGKSGE
jgi:hypothetical protein